jgi:hypothetical protein
VVIATLAPGAYATTWNGEPVDHEERYPGTLEVHLPAGVGAGTLVVVPL